jgi:hypothetical protein
MEALRLNDDVIANIAKIVQIAILTGTDIVDNLRMIQLVDVGDNILGIHEDFQEQLENNIQKMLDAAENFQENNKSLDQT